MAAAAEPIEKEKVKFRTQMVNGKAQIYFDAFEQPAPPPPKPKSKRNSRATINPPAPLPPAAPSKAKAVRTTKPTKVTFKQDESKVGVFMTMEEIAELVRSVKEGPSVAPPTVTKMTTIEALPPPPPIVVEPPPQPVVVVEPPAELVQQIFASTSPRGEALGLMAEKKRQKWMREKAEMDRMKLEVEYDQLKHQLTPQNQRSTAAAPAMIVDSAAAPPPLQEYPSDFSKTRLMEKKQQQWRQENAEKAPVWNPFGRPGAGAPNANELPPRPPPNNSNVVTPFRPVEPAASLSLNDQTRVPAAMRTNLLFGDVRFEDDVRTAKEVERRQWLDDLRKQIEENKKQKSTQLETERRQDFLQENLQPLVQEAANRHQNLGTTPTKETPVAPAAAETNRSTQHDSVVEQTYKKILEATELAKYEKKAQLIERLKRNGHKTELLAKTLPEVQSNSKGPEKMFDSPPPKKPVAAPTTTKIEPLHLNMGTDPLQSFRGNENKRDEAVNTINSTFRSDNSVQTDFRLVPPKQMFAYLREESDLPPQVPNHLLRSAKQSKKNVRIRSSEDPTPRQRRNSATTTTLSKDDGHLSQMESQRTRYDLVHRPLWNYQNQEHRVYVPNSQRDPKNQKKSRIEPPAATTTLKSNTYNRWKSDGELKKEKPQQTIVNLPPRTNRGDTFQISSRPHDDHQSMFSNISSLDRYEHFIPYTRTDEVLDPARAYSPVPISREPSAAIVVKPTRRETNRSTVNAQPPPYHVPPSRQDHILQQLSAIKENLVRRQQELTSSMNAIPV